VLYCGCTVLYSFYVALYGVGTRLKFGVACPIIISSCTLYASNVLSRIKYIVLQCFSSWPIELQKLQYELFGTVWYFCIIGQ
jgi:hypothetical protein